MLPDCYYFALCHVCKKPSHDLKKCSSCQVLHYCSREHQIQDWPSHKQLCKAITKTNKCLVCPPNPTKDEFNHFKASLGLLWQCAMQRKLKLFETHMWMFPKICKICYSKEVTITCQTCWSSGYCSDEHYKLHYETHKKWCPSLKLHLVFNQSIADTVKLEDLWNLKIDQLQGESFPENMEQFIQIFGKKWIEAPYKPDYSNIHLSYLRLSVFFCHVANMVYALEKSHFIEKRLGKKTKLVIHIVGCDTSEIMVAWHFVLEFLSHWITNLKQSQLYVIGPRIAETFNFTLNISHCNECTAKNYIANVLAIQALYHDVVDSIMPPDLVIAFNSGLHEFSNTEKDTWKDSIPTLVQFKDVPTTLTAYTETELQQDLERFEKMKFKFIIKPHKNPFASLLPSREWQEGNEPIYFEHNYITIISMGA